MRREDINWELNAVVLGADRGTKKTGITFFNEETRAWLDAYLDSKPKSWVNRLFAIGTNKFKEMWGVASKAAGLRKWHAVELRLAGVPESFVDIFRGRAPRTVLSQYYTPVGIKELRKVYEKANLSIGVDLP